MHKGYCSSAIYHFNASQIFRISDSGAYLLKTPPKIVETPQLGGPLSVLERKQETGAFKRPGRKGSFQNDDGRSLEAGMDDTQVHQPEMPRVLSSRKSPMAKQAMVVSYTKPGVWKC